MTNLLLGVLAVGVALGIFEYLRVRIWAAKFLQLEANRDLPPREVVAAMEGQSGGAFSSGVFFGTSIVAAYQVFQVEIVGWDGCWKWAFCPAAFFGIGWFGYLGAKFALKGSLVKYMA